MSEISKPIIENDERDAWDNYFAIVRSMTHIYTDPNHDMQSEAMFSIEDAAKEADKMLEERRKREFTTS